MQILDIDHMTEATDLPNAVTILNASRPFDGADYILTVSQPGDSCQTVTHPVNPLLHVVLADFCSHKECL